MKSSYKIAVISAFVLVIIVFASYLTMEKPGKSAAKPTAAPTPDTGMTAETATDATAGGTNRSKESVDEVTAQMRSHFDAVDGVPAPSSTPPAAGISTGKTATGSPATQPSSIALAPATQPATPSPRSGTIVFLPPRPHDSGIFDSSPGDHHAAGSTASVPVTPRTYKIAAGDTFITIAQKELGSSNRWHELAEANPLVDPSKLKVGQVIKLPETTAAGDGSRSASASGVSASAITHTHSSTLATDGGTTYIVQAGDTLSSIARQYYNNRGLWKTIYAANKSTLNGSPNHVREGMKLTIPPLSTAAR